MDWETGSIRTVLSSTSGPLWIVVGALLTWLLPYVPYLRDSPIQVLIGLGFLFVAPGYALLWALDGRGIEFSKTEVTGSTDLPLERLLLAVGTSLSIAILSVIVIDISPLSVTGPTLRTVAVLFTLGCLVVGMLRSTEAATVVSSPGRDKLSPLSADLLQSASLREVSKNGLLSVAMLALAISAIVGAGFLLTNAGSEGTEIALLEERPNGKYIAVGSTSAPAEGDRLLIRIENHAQHEQSYAVVAAKERVVLSNGTIQGTTVQQLQEWRITVDAGETRSIDHQLPAVADNASIRIAYRLYVGDTGHTDEVETSGVPDRQLHVWPNGTEPPTITARRGGS